MLKEKILLAVSLLAAGLNAFWLQNEVFGGLAALLFLLVTGRLTGRWLFGDRSDDLQLALGSASVLAVLSILGTALYYLLPVTTAGLFAILAIAGISVMIIPIRRSSTDKLSFIAWLKQLKVIDVVLIMGGLIALAAWWNVVLQTHIVEPVRTLWAVISPVAIIAIGLALLISFTLLTRERTRVFSVVLFSATLFSIISLASFVYPLGYGFDPFLHRATVEHIAAYGTITPKPLYYIGQYALELFAVKVFSLPLLLVDIFLGPVMATVALVTLGLSINKNKFGLAAVLLIPLGIFVSTTPQALGNVWFLLTMSAVLLSCRVPALLFAIAALITHPLAGIPACLLVLFSFVQQIVSKPLRIIAYIFLCLLGATVLPVLFFVQGKLGGLDIPVTLSHIGDLTRLGLTGFFSNNFNSWYDGLYLVIQNSALLLVLCAIAFFVVGKREIRSSIIAPTVLSITLFVSYLAISWLFDFDYLIAYERGDYAGRVLTLALFALVPATGGFVSSVTDHLRSRPVALQASFFVLLSFIGLAATYGTYPRHDNYARSAGFNVGQADIATVHAINSDAGDTPYVVLSDQALAAAAVQEFGFATYYHTDIFYYPIPTGGPLYQLYLQMVNEQPSLEIIDQAKSLTGAHRVYFALHNYWWQSDAIIENAKLSADHYFAIDHGAVTVFVYE